MEEITQTAQDPKPPKPPTKHEPSWTVQKTRITIGLVVISVFVLMLASLTYNKTTEQLTFIVVNGIALIAVIAMLSSAYSAQKALRISQNQEHEMGLQRKAMVDTVKLTEKIVAEMQGQREVTAYQLAQSNSQIINSRDQAIQMIRQVDIMQDQLAALNIEPRLRIEDVSARNFQPNHVPLFVVQLANLGNIDAIDVSIFLRVDASDGEHRGTKWSREQIVQIPAKTTKPFFASWGIVLSQAAFDGFFKDVRLELTGYFKYNGNQTDFCYKYFPYGRRERPKDIPDFLPCDFDPGTTLLITVGDSAKADDDPYGDKDEDSDGQNPK